MLLPKETLGKSNQAQPHDCERNPPTVEEESRIWSGREQDAHASREDCNRQRKTLLPQGASSARGNRQAISGRFAGKKTARTQHYFTKFPQPTPPSHPPCRSTEGSVRQANGCFSSPERTRRGKINQLARRVRGNQERISKRLARVGAGDEYYFTNANKRVCNSGYARFASSA